MDEKSLSQRTQFPNHWSAIKINDLCEFVVDCIHHTPELSDSPTGFFMVRTSDVGGGHVRLENARFISKEVYEDRIQRGKPQWGDIIISREAPLGNVGQILTDENICLGQRLIHYRPNKDIVDIRYLLFALLSPMVQKQFRANEGRGSIVDNLLMQTAKDLLIPIPPLNEQQKIAAVLSALDAKIELNQRINAELESMAKTLYDYWFVQFDFPNEKGKPYKSAGGVMVWNEALKREIPLGWEVKKVRDFAETSSGGTPLSTKYEYYDNGTIPWINSGELNDPFIVKGSSFITEKGLNNSSAKMFPVNTVLVALYGATAGKVSLLRIEACSNQAVCGILPNSQVYTNFLKYGFENLYKHLVILSSGSARDNLSQEIVRNISFAMPQENDLLEKFNNIVNPSLKKIVANLLESQTLTELRDWLLPMLMNGQVKV